MQYIQSNDKYYITQTYIQSYIWHRKCAETKYVSNQFISLEERMKIEFLHDSIS